MATRVVNTVLSMRDQFTSPARRATNSVRTMRTELRRTTRGVQRFGKQFKNTMKNTVKFAGTAAVLGLAAFAKKSIDLASDLREVQNVVDTTFGEGSKSINEFSKNAIDQFGLTELEAKRYSGTLGAMLKSSGLAGKEIEGMAKNLTGLTGDFASFYNLRSEDAFTKIKAGLTGSVEPLQALGINMSVANLESYRLSKGIKTQYKNMTQSQKVMLRYNYLLSVSKDAQGDFAKTSASWANQTRILQANVSSLGASIGDALLPYLETWIGKVNEYFPIMREKADEFKEAIPGIVDNLKKVLDPLVKNYQYIKNNWTKIEPIIKTIVGGLAAYKLALIAQKTYTLASAAASAIYTGVMATGATSVNVMTIAQWALNAAFNANPIGFVITLITALVGAGILLYQNWDTVKEKLGEAWQGISKATSFAIQGMSNAWNGFKEGFVKTFDVIKVGFINTWILMKNGLIEAVNFMIGGINTLIETINSIPLVDIGEIPELEKDQLVKIEKKEVAKNENVPKAPKNALGTKYWRGGQTQINEFGKEQINLPSGSQIIPATQVEKSNKSNIEVNVNIENVNNQQDIDSFMNTVVRRIELALENKF